MSETSQKLLLIDGLNILRRCYEANPAPDSPGKADGALKSAMGSIKRALQEHQPTHVLPIFDHGGKTFRHEFYPEYKADRKPMAAELLEKIPVIFEMLRAIGLKAISIPNVEADDVIASVFFVWNNWGGQSKGECIILSTDKDMCQLVQHGAQVRNHFSNCWHDASYIEEKWGIRPELVGDLLSLTGGDGEVPGVPGFGPKYAAKYLNQYGSLDEILENAAQIPGKLGEKLRASVEEAKLSRRLVTLKTGIPVGITWNQIIFTPLPSDKDENDDGIRPVATHFAKPKP
jgi:5'-3' exonuclease